MDKQELVVGKSNSPAELIQLALTNNADLDKLEKLLALREKWEAGEAKKAYTRDLAEFKKEVPDVLRDKKNKQYNSRYASKGNLIKTITPVLGKFGFSANFSYKNLPDNWLEATCRLTHSKGHSEEVSFSAPADTSGQKNVIQQRKSTLTYLEKITFAGILGIESLEEVDDDGQSAGEIKNIDNKQVSEFCDIIDNSANPKGTKAKFLEVMGVEKLEDIQEKDFEKAKGVLKTAPQKK